MSDHTSLYRLFNENGALLYIGIAGNPGRRFEQHAKEKAWWSQVANVTLTHYATRAEAAAAEAEAIKVERPRFNVAHARPSPLSYDGVVFMAFESLDITQDRWNTGINEHKAAQAAARIAVDAIWPTLLEIASEQATGPRPRNARQPELASRCSGCGELIANGQGYIEVDHRHAVTTEQALTRRKSERLAAALAKHPDDLTMATIEASSGSVRDLFAIYDDVDVEAPWLAWHAKCDPNPEVSGYWFAVERCRTWAELIDWNNHLTEKGWVRYTNWTSVLSNVASGLHRPPLELRRTP